MPLSKYDRYFGGKPGAASRAREQMRRTYGKEKGEDVFRATIVKRERKEKKRAR